MSRVATKYDDAVTALYRAPFDAFVAERKRLSAELAPKDGAGAVRLSKITRPPISAWAVNQLYWQDKKTFSELFKTAEKLRDPEPSAEETAAHRDVISTLRNHAATLLSGAGKSATESTLRRVTTTLSALAATGGFDPDPPGALKGDRDPPGFNVTGLSPASVKTRKPEKARAKAKPAKTKGEARAAESPSGDFAASRKAKAEAVAERRRVEREEKQRRVERERLERKLRIAKGVFEARKEDISRLKQELEEAEDAIDGARGVVREIEKELAKL
jgi:hypothetical protein